MNFQGVDSTFLLSDNMLVSTNVLVKFAYTNRFGIAALTSAMVATYLLKQHLWATSPSNAEFWEKDEEVSTVPESYDADGEASD